MDEQYAAPPPPEPQHEVYFQTPPPVEPPKKTWPQTIALIVAGVALLVGILIGTAAGGGSTDKPETVVVTGPGATTTTVPQACLDALDEADTVIQYSTEFAGIVSDLLTDLSQFDFGNVDAFTTQVQGITAKVTAITPSYLADKAACRSED